MKKMANKNSEGGDGGGTKKWLFWGDSLTHVIGPYLLTEIWEW
jgi:hypothetical protein